MLRLIDNLWTSFQNHTARASSSPLETNQKGLLRSWHDLIGFCEAPTRSIESIMARTPHPFFQTVSPSGGLPCRSWDLDLPLLQPGWGSPDEPVRSLGCVCAREKRQNNRSSAKDDQDDCRGLWMAFGLKVLKVNGLWGFWGMPKSGLLFGYRYSKHSRHS